MTRRKYTIVLWGGILTLLCLIAYLEIISKPNFEDFCFDGEPIQANLCAVKDDRAAIVTVISDDGFYESGLILNELARERDLHVTVAGVVNNLSGRLRKWQTIETEGYIEIISHSYSHLKINDETNPSYQAIFHEYVDAREWFQKNFKTPAFCFVTPNNNTTQVGYEIFEKNGFLAVRQGRRGENSLSPVYGRFPGEWLNLKTRGIGDVKTTAERNEWVDRAISEGSWLIEMWHDVSPDGDVHYQPISTAMAAEHLDYLAQRSAEKAIWVAPFTQAVSYIYQKQHTTVRAFLKGDLIAVKAERSAKELPWKEFNIPLSAEIVPPKDWKGIRAYKGYDARIVKKNEGRYLVDISPTDDILYLERIY